MHGAKEFVSGKGVYVGDINMPGMLHMAVARSRYGRAVVNSVKGGITGKELRAYMSSVGEGTRRGMRSTNIEPVLAQGRVNYAGQPIAIVLGRDSYSAEDMLEEVDVEYTPLRPMMTIDEALAGEPIHKGTKSNVLASGDMGSSLAGIRADVSLEGTFDIARVMPNPMETRGLVASYDGKRLTVWISTQSVFSIREGLCESLGLDKNMVRVVQADTGGAFGVKGGMYPEYVAAAYASMKLKKPVKWIETRREHLMASNPGRGARGTMTVLARRNGRVLGIEGRVVVDAGAYGGGMGEFSAPFIAMQLTGPYAIERACAHTMAVMTNKPPHGPYRGAGRPEAAFFMERMMDMLADKLGIDQAELRLKNTSSKPFKSQLGLSIGPARGFFNEALAKLRYREAARIGRPGIGFFVLVPAVQPGESARLSVSGGRIEAWLGGNSHGQGHEQFTKRLVSEELGVDPGLIQLNNGDTDAMKGGVGSWGSRSAVVGGAALVAASRKLMDEVARKAGKYSADALLAGEYDVYVFEPQNGQNNSFGANLATAEVDDYGLVRVKECAAYYDVGRALNPGMVVGQIVGGMAQGVGQALYEELLYDKEGALVTRSIADAGVPVAKDMPSFSVGFAEHRSRLPHGAKGLGEAPTIGTLVAIARAVERVTGVRITSTPIKPELLIHRARNR